MKHYPKERKDAVIAKMAHHPSLPELAKQEGISLPTLYAWRRKAREQGILMPSGDDTPDGWSSADKFNAVLQTATMNDAELAEFCRAQGLYPEQIQRWKSACQNANDWDQKRSSELEKNQRQDRAELKKIQVELRRKEKALAEAAALLVLQKKFNALLDDEEV
jgi:transposase-like protein